MNWARWCALCPTRGGGGEEKWVRCTAHESGIGSCVDIIAMLLVVTTVLLLSTSPAADHRLELLTVEEHHRVG